MLRQRERQRGREKEDIPNPCISSGPPTPLYKLHWGKPSYAYWREMTCDNISLVQRYLVSFIFRSLSTPHTSLLTDAVAITVACPFAFCCKINSIVKRNTIKEESDNKRNLDSVW
jgi:hypothetical protein